MRHRVKGKKLNRNINQRKALFKNLTRDLILKGRIKTTEAKAKTIRPIIEKLVTKAKKGDLYQRRQVLAILAKDAVDKLFNEVVLRFKDKKSGFIRIVKLRKRRGDNAPQVLLEWSKDLEPKPKESKSGKAKKKKGNKGEKTNPTNQKR